MPPRLTGAAGPGWKRQCLEATQRFPVSPSIAHPHRRAATDGSPRLDHFLDVRSLNTVQGARDSSPADAFPPLPPVTMALPFLFDVRSCRLPRAGEHSDGVSDAGLSPSRGRVRAATHGTLLGWR